ncbi:MAG: ABC transporter substrate-binding protein [Pseudoruegeria sp.]
MIFQCLKSGLAFSVFAAAYATTALAEPVKIGCLYPLTGPGGLYGRDSAIAIEMAMEDLAKHESERYPDLEILIEDSRSKTLRSLQIARQFIEEDEVDFLCGVVSSSIALAVTKVVEGTDVFFIGTDHASPSLTSSALHENYFRVTNGSRQSMLAGAQYIQRHFSTTQEAVSIVFIGPDYEYGYQSWDDLRKFLKINNVNFTVVGTYWPKLFNTDYSSYIDEINATQPDIIVNGHWGLDLVTFIRQASQTSLFETSAFMNFDAGGNFEVLGELGNEVPLGITLSSRHHVNWPPTSANHEFVTRFFEHSGRYPSYAAQGAYSGIMVIAEAVRKAGGTDDPSALRTALEHIEIHLPEDPAGFSSRMDPIHHQMLQVQAIGRTVQNSNFAPATVQLGDWEVFYPPENWPSLIENE